MPKINRALISVSNKTGLLELATALRRHGVEILSTGGTAKSLADAGIPVVQVSDYTGQPEILEGRVKTLVPRIHGGILARRGLASHKREMKAHDILPIDLVVVNLYPFESAAFRDGATFENAIENIDIGGPTMVRAAAKNFADVTVVVDPSDYPAIVAELDARRGAVLPATNFALARKAFAHTAYYDSVIAGWLATAQPDTRKPVPAPPAYPPTLVLPLVKVQDLRYGENPHQRAALYREPGPPVGVAGAAQLGGKELSFNNLLDLEAAWAAARDFSGRPFAVIVKHNNPCGAGIGSDPTQAFELALAGDPISAFGGVIGVSRLVSPALAKKIVGTFFEAIIAPGFAPKALEILRSKKDLRILQAAPGGGRGDLKRVAGGYLLQDLDSAQIRDVRKLPIVTKRKPTAAEYRALDFAWRMVRHVKSNAIIFTTDRQLAGVGAGQMSRVDSCRIAALKAVLALKGTVVGSDAFFPFRDGVDQIAAAGATAVIQPGGSLRDKEAIEAADAHGLAMVFTGVRHFKH
ncbi:MAG: bifunctional phosphoribosylaminoimidazolecarboxamide formyltransferase/IMP cyclohydrolase [Candidatus Methylomirabilia bacterium]